MNGVTAISRVGSTLNIIKREYLDLMGGHYYEKKLPK
jgi:hypothetical protein